MKNTKYNLYGFKKGEEIDSVVFIEGWIFSLDERNFSLEFNGSLDVTLASHPVIYYFHFIRDLKGASFFLSCK